jgi:hypothetical protein
MYPIPPILHLLAPSQILDIGSIVPRSPPSAQARARVRTQGSEQVSKPCGRYWMCLFLAARMVRSSCTSRVCPSGLFFCNVHVSFRPILFAIGVYPSLFRPLLLPLAVPCSHRLKTLAHSPRRFSGFCLFQTIILGTPINSELGLSISSRNESLQAVYPIDTPE